MEMKNQVLEAKQGHWDRLWVFIWTSALAKLLINTSKRMIYPFAPAIARGLGVDIGSVTSIIAVNQSMSVLSPFIVVMAGRIGYRFLILISFMFFSLAMFAAGLIPLYSVVMLAFLIVGLAKSIVDPVLQAVAGNLVSYERRGMVIGIIETAWAGSTLIGLPLTGWLIEKYSWQTPFLIYGVLALGVLCVLVKIFPDDPQMRSERAAEKRGQVGIWKQILGQRKVYPMFIFAFFMCMANDNLFVVYGIWLETGFGMSLSAIGLGAVFIGMSEILGEALTASFSDRIGLKKSIVVGTFLTAVSYCTLVPAGSSLILVMSGLFVVFLSFEFTIVTSMSAATELVPEYRAATMSLYFAAAGVGRVIGAVSGGMLWTEFGITGVCVFSAAATACGLAAIVFHKK